MFKLKIKLTVVCFLLALFCSCSEEALKNISHNYAKKKPFIETTQYNSKAHLIPIWNTREIYDQQVFFIGETSCCTLLYPPTEVHSVRSASFKTKYTEGIDYRIEGNKIFRLKGSKIPYFELEDYFITDQTEKQKLTICNPGQYSEQGITTSHYIFYREYSDNKMSVFVEKSICVSYSHNSKNVLTVPKDQSIKALRIFNKLARNEKVTVLFYGDSITTGASASGIFNCDPQTPMWPKIVYNYLTDYYSNTNSEYINTSKGGWTTSKGFEYFSTNVLGKDADILVLAWGMNDIGQTCSYYHEYMELMCNAFLEENPDGLIVLVSPMMPNTLWKDSQTSIYKFEKELWEIAQGNNHIIVAPVSQLFIELLENGIESRTWLANNVNHPNDFSTRLYAQVILKALMGNRFSVEMWRPTP